MISISQLGANYEKLIDILDPYDADIAAAADRLTFKSKTITEANKEQAVWPSYYDQRRAELQTLSKYFQQQVNKTRGLLFQKYTENHSRDLSERDKQKYIDKDDEFLTINELYLEVDEYYEKFKAIVEAFRIRGYALRNLVDIQINQLNDNLL